MTDAPRVERAFDALYAALSEPFDVTFTDVRGGAEITYITGEQCATRCNEVLGPGGWYSKMLHFEIHQEADEVLVLCEMGAKIDGEWIIRQQFGSQKIKRSRSTGVPLDIGFDYKGAATDAFKKCASLFGVALYLSHKKPPAQRGGNARQPSRPQPSRPPQQPQQTFRSDRNRGAPYDAGTSSNPKCQQCGEALAPMTFEVERDGRKVPVTWSVQELARIAKRDYAMVLCEKDFRAARKQSPKERDAQTTSAANQ